MSLFRKQKGGNEPGYNPATLESLPQVLCDGFVSDLVISQLFLHLQLPPKDFLVCQPDKALD